MKARQLIRRVGTCLATRSLLRQHRRAKHQQADLLMAWRCAGDLLQELSGRVHELGSSAMSVPAGISGTVSTSAHAVPRLLLGDIVAVYHAAGDALADLNAKGVHLHSFKCCLSPATCNTTLRHLSRLAACLPRRSWQCRLHDARRCQ
jgi:hypothetical protein